MFGRSCSISAALLAGSASPARRSTRACLALLDLADHDAVADHHLERVDRAVLRQRIDVDRLDPVLGRVVEDLRDAGADGRPADREIDVDAEPRRLGVAVVRRSSAAASRSARRRAGPGPGRWLRRGAARLDKKSRNCQREWRRRLRSRRSAMAPQGEPAQPAVVWISSHVVMSACSRSRIARIDVVRESASLARA